MKKDFPRRFQHPPRRRAAARAGAALALACVAAVAALAVRAPALGAKPQDKAQPPPQVAFSSEQTGIRYVDPSTGRPIWTAQVASSSAQSGAQAGEIVGALRGVRGTFYQNGAAVDRMTAPLVTAAQSGRRVTVTASGGVFVQSISQPDSSLRCDTAVWDSSTNQILGRGHVVLRKGSFTQQGPSILGDVKLRSAVMPAPGGPRAAGAIHSHFAARKK